ncbi:hypothetical protein DEO72_LG3g990 [Vigna unguiculata]|uniref:Uncharacterized protein n=1 Tax=Vigna unguiculata TaxID=3917 RepID=A0A4D6LD07_VIGUN|nr:hypothetical protein DEO72_LG3g990 [Vigna unguiculata]
MGGTGVSVRVVAHTEGLYSIEQSQSPPKCVVLGDFASGKAIYNWFHLAALRQHQVTTQRQWVISLDVHDLQGFGPPKCVVLGDFASGKAIYNWFHLAALRQHQVTTQRQWVISLDVHDLQGFGVRVVAHTEGLYSIEQSQSPPKCVVLGDFASGKAIYNWFHLAALRQHQVTTQRQWVISLDVHDLQGFG